MAQKDKVKELVGRGLDSYHTKALQQIDRIDKKNKEQNHKISILSNELDNDYLTKTEEGSVVSLEHSKEGMVYLDELQGNTLVNYCTDGSKEMTLNGDIDEEGTFVTTTEGVDNGLVDVACEGNTLVNLGGKVNKQSNRYGLLLKSTMILKPSTLYTFIVTNLSNQSVQFYRSESVFNATTDRSKVVPANSTIVFTWTTLDTLTDDGLIKSEMDGTTQFTLDVVVLEGDWTNRELPTSYFEGMKSVGQDDENGHKIEILSNNNIFNESFIQGGYASNDDFYALENRVSIKNVIPAISNKEYIVNIEDDFECEIRFYDIDKVYISNIFWLKSKEIFTTPSNCKYLKIAIKRNDNSNINPNQIKYFYCGIFNKKEILLNEPLRGLPSGVKDKKVKIGNKWYIERKCKQETFDGSSDENWYVQNSNLENYSIFKLYVKNTPYASSGGRINQITDIINSEVPTWSNLLNIEKECTHLYGDKLLYVKISNSKLVTQDVDGFIKWLKNNNINIVYELATPIYEPLEVEPILNTYNDITHISNNSIIPCNMKIQNSGYNAIIKPSTLYTVALDTNKSGTIGMNLGGVKGTTTNNVLKLTTPATLTDDSLRLYGKGIKGSKVRLLEGDKTNWIPSHFEGMKSSFEDKFDATDNTYKMEILSNNKNLFRIKDVITYNGGQSVVINENSITITQQLEGAWKYYGYGLSHLKPNTKYTVSANIEGDANTTKVRIFNWYNEKEVTSFSGNSFRTFTTPNDTSKLAILLYTSYNISKPIGTVGKFSNIMIEEGDKTSYVPYLLNKIQFSSIEPLRSLPGGVKDKFIFKDGKLMIERNTSKTKITSDMNFTRSYEGWVNIVFACEVDGLIPIDISTKNVYCNVLPSFSIADLCNTLGKTGIASHNWANNRFLQIAIKGIDTVDKLREWISERDVEIVYQIESYYEEIPFELQKIILEGYENGTLFFDTNIPPTSTVTYAGETPIVKSAKSNRVEVASNTTDINDNIIPYLCDMDYRIVTLELQQQLPIQTGMFKLFGGVYEMLKRDILSKRLSKSEYEYRLTDYFNVGKLTEQQVRELEDLINE